MEQHQPAVRGKHIVFLQGVGAGHINPTVPLVAAMVKQGIKVTFFAPSVETAMGRGDAVSDGTPEGELVKSAGATLLNYRFDPSLADEPLLTSQNPMHPGKFFTTLPPLLADLKGLQPPPAVLVYDCFLYLPQVAGKILGIPAVGLIPNTGPACTAPYETAPFLDAFQGPAEFVRSKYGIDVLELGVPFVSWYSPLLNVVLTDEAFFVGFGSDAQKERFGAAPFHCVGSLVDPKSTVRPPVPDFPLDSIAAAREAGKRIVLISLGSAVTGLLWARLPPGEHGFASGKEFAHHVWKAAFGALGSADDVLVVMALGPHADALEGLSVPANFMPFPVVPQLEALPLCDAFVTHGGMGSVMESVAFGVPMVVVPVSWDQPDNADTVQRLNMGVAFRRPRENLGAESLGKAVAQLLEPALSEEYRQAVASTAARMQAAGGAARTIELIFSVAK